MQKFIFSLVAILSISGAAHSEEFKICYDAAVKYCDAIHRDVFSERNKKCISQRTILCENDNIPPK
ncbi:hypothetical protein WKW50_00720 [Ochrobactrum sp. GPK 3]|uniref:hypothetical protein n=1 Tax=Brucella sp. 22210 TaxID=3453892 RepID=UPI003138528D